MKKYWQIKPWMFIVIGLIVVGSLFYAFKDFSGYPEWSAKSVDYAESSGSYAAPQAMSEEVYRSSASLDESAYDSSYDGDNSATTVDFADSERMIIKTGYISMVVDNVNEAVKAIVEYTEEKGGFLVSSNIDKTGIDLSGEVTVRIPAEFFDDTITDVKEMGEVKS
jgi:hypothetical protein